MYLDLKNITHYRSIKNGNIKRIAMCYCVLDCNNNNICNIIIDNQPLGSNSKQLAERKRKQEI